MTRILDFVSLWLVFAWIGIIGFFGAYFVCVLVQTAWGAFRKHVSQKRTCRISALGMRQAAAKEADS